MTRILVTRPSGQAEEIVALLARAGIDVVAVPTVAIDPIEPTALRAALATGPDWLVITSANGAAALDGAAIPHETRVAAVGPATAAALRRRGVRVDHVPGRYLTIAIAEGLGDLRGLRVLLARADSATPELRDALLARGAQVDEVVAYRTQEAPARSRGPLNAVLREPLDGVAFTSGSTVRGLVALADPAALRRARELPAFCIGPVTAAAARGAGLRVTATAREHNAAGLVGTIADHFAEARR